MTHHLVQSTLVAVGQHVLHRAEVGGVDLDRSELVLGLCLGQADARHRRMAEHRARDVFVIHPVRLAAEDRVGERLPLADRDGRQLHAVGHVADGIDAVTGRCVIGINHHRARVVQFDPGARQPQPSGIGGPSRREQHAIDVDRLMPRHRYTETPIGLPFDPLKRRVEAEIEPLHHRNLQQPVADRFVIAAQDHVAAVDQRHLRAEFVEDPGKFIGDIARARDQDALGHRVEIEHLVRSDAVFVPRAFRNDRCRAGGDQDVLCGHFAPAAQRQAVRPGYLCAIEDDLDTVIGQRVGIGGVDAIDLFHHIVAQPLPVEVEVFGHIPAEAPRVLQILGEMRAVDEQLLRHAAADDAGAADAIFLRHRHLGAMRRRNARRAGPAGTGTDDEKVVVEIAHYILTPSPRTCSGVHRA